MKSGLTLRNNIFGYYFGSTFVESNNSPFVEGWKLDKKYWIQTNNIIYQNEFYQVIRISKNDKYVYQVVSEYSLSGVTFSSINDRTCFINYKAGYTYNCKTMLNPSGYTNYISGLTTDFTIDSYYEDGERKNMFGDLYIINIDGSFHILKIRDGSYYIQTDFAINSYPTGLEYWKGGRNSKYYTSKPVYTYGNKPLSYPVYRIKFSDIKDFDFERLDTHFADFDYEKDIYYSTDEHKLYATDYNDTSVLNKTFMTHQRGEDGQYKIMNVSSEYVADDELYEISFNDLTDIWRKNQSVVKWGFGGSNSNCDYPYKLNNSIDIGDIYNSTCNVSSTVPSAVDKNLDYFYRIGNFYSGNTTNLIKYLNQTTNIEVDLMKSYSEKFNLDIYLNSNVDYFDYFFKNKMNFTLNDIDYVKSTCKYSILDFGDKYSPSTTVFKGLNVNAIGVKSISRDKNGKILNTIVDSNKNFNGYKFAIILNDVYDYYDGTGKTLFDLFEYGLTGNTVIDKSTNAIHVFLNEKFKNFLIVINVKIPIQSEYITLNNIPHFGEKFGIYNAKTLDNISLVYPATGVTEYNPALITVSNFYDAFDDFNTVSEFNSGITFYYVDSLGRSGSTGPINIYNSGNTMSLIPDWYSPNPPFVLNFNYPELLETKKSSYTKSAIKGPATNIYDKYQTYYDKSHKQKYDISDPLARSMKLNSQENNMNTVYAENSVYYPNKIYRYNGVYEPIFNDIPLFNNTYLYYINLSALTLSSWNSNYKFDTSFENFGTIDELMFSKVNPNITPLKLKNTDKDKSIYPMVDEYGYQTYSRFIFSSSWDKDYYFITNSDQNINKMVFSNFDRYDYIVDPIKTKES